MITYQEKFEQSNKLLEEIKVLTASDNAEEKQKIPAMLADVKKLREEAAQLSEIEQLVSEGKTFNRNPEAKAAPTDPGKFNTMGEFFVAVNDACDAKSRKPVDRRLLPFKQVDEPANPPFDGKAGWSESEQKTMAEGVGASGGFLVPTEFLAQLQAVDPEANPVRARATVIPMRRRQINVPVLNQTGSTAGQANWFGSVVAYWTEEGAAKSETNPTFRQASLVAHKLVCYSRSTDELLDDSAISLEALLRGPLGFTGAIAWYEEYAFLRGTGAGQPLGIINAGATLHVHAAANPPAPGTFYPDLCSMMEAFLPSGRGVWYINQGHKSELLQMNGPAANPIYIWGNAITGEPNTLLGLPVVWTEKLPAPGTAGSVLLADVRYYLIGDRQATTVESNRVGARWQYDETEWRAVHRVDGQPWLSAPITLQDGTQQVSPFVILEAKTT